ncbi:aminodeoxychorismate synthase component I [Rubrivirga sp. IMCC43871]|uniref:aminodeoxychorismate synthase component I n=1 Tax=Rubrivirga sp. IMCC43871 TaxID=3391575 RepID=UPI0039900B5E
MLADALRHPGTVLLDAPRPDADSGRRGARLFSDARRQLRADTPAEVEALLDGIDASLGDGLHVAGFLSYEAGAALVGLAPGPQVSGVPLGWFGVYDAPVEVAPDALAHALGAAGPSAVSDVRLGVSAATYRAAFDTVRAHIRAGDVYQVNLTAPLGFALDGDALALYAALRRRQQVAYGAFLHLDGLAVASVSPELFFRIDPGGDGRTVTTRPMKGTAPRGDTASADRALTDDLLASPKDRAENLMIVDLLRNDVSRIAEPGSVLVPTLFHAEHYETVTQMTSTVTGRVRPDASLGDVLRALFPCGSVTGAPKRRAMEVIRSVEPSPRGVYCGAIGTASPDGTAAFNVAIRTAVVQGGEGRYGVGSGVVWDSRADAEYAECLLKGRVLTDLA